MQNQESYIVAKGNGMTAYVGPDATEYVRAATLASMLKLFAKTGIVPTRRVSGSMLLKMATRYTGKTYKRGQHETAAADVKVWADTMKCALPIVGEK